jgi:transcriptional regulator with PAS, ATPase and Fis domain
MSSFRLSNGEERSIGVRPFLRLAQSASVEGVLEEFTRIAVEEGIELCSVSCVRAGWEREFKLSGAGGGVRRVCALDVHVEGGLTRFIVKFYEPANPLLRADLEFAAYLAAYRIELLAGNRLRVAREGKGSKGASIIGELIGRSELIQGLGRSILAAAGVNSSVLITGESGTGKEVVARAIHAHSARASQPFIAVNCAALPEHLIESELFGHERGAFTGADKLRKGRFEIADRGTIFLDEIGELPLLLQPKLLRVLQERVFERVGGTQAIAMRARIIAATNRNLQREIEEHRFREDLYFRLLILRLNTPALREHPADIPLLVDFFLDKIRERLEFTYRPEIEEEALRLLCRYRWPGNVRELDAMLERMATEAGDGYAITAAQARNETGPGSKGGTEDIEYPAILHAGEYLDEFLSRQELAVYQMMLDRCGGNHALAAKRLGIGRTTLHERVKSDRRKLATGEFRRPEH